MREKLRSVEDVGRSRCFFFSSSFGSSVSQVKSVKLDHGAGPNLKRVETSGPLVQDGLRSMLPPRRLNN